MARRSRLTAWIILALLTIAVVLAPSGLHAPATLAAVGVVAGGSLLAAILNRAGYVTAAGALLVLLIVFAVVGALVGVPKGELSLIYLPAYDLFAVAVVIAASILPRAATFVVAVGCVGVIVADLALQPHAADITDAIATYGAASLVTRPIALLIVVATVAYLWVRGTDDAIRRADRAEEIAAIEHAIVEQKRQLDYGIQQILETHVRVANGDFSARAPLNQDNVLWQIAASLNNLLSRLQKSGQAEYQLRRTEEEIRRLAVAIRDAQLGRAAIWPAPTGTAADLLLEVMGRGSRDAGQASLQSPRGYPQNASGYGPAAQSGYPQSGQSSQYGPPPSQAPDPGMSANNPWTVPYEDQR
ncbi:MAG TPA: hypothetical protein VFU88_22120 [Ktedonobacterales bacterium]|nr:hypothetical protein [Ktedonobacterales bacterium]